MEVGLESLNLLTPEGLVSTLSRNFSILEDFLRSVPQADQGITSVTGELLIPTELKEVTHVVASLGVDPVAGACYVFGVPGLVYGSPSSARIRVYSSTFVLSVIPTLVSWIAVGVA